MRVFETWQNGDQEAIGRLLTRLPSTTAFFTKVLETCSRFERIQRLGDAGIQEMIDLSPASAEKSFWHPSPGGSRPPGPVQDFFERIAARIRSFYEAQVRPSWFQSTPWAELLGQKSSGLERVLVSLPAISDGGQGAAIRNRLLLAMALHYGIPAKIAGAREVMLNVPRPLPPELEPLLGTLAELLGASPIFALPESAALLGFCCGTESVPRADRIFGIVSEAGQPAAQIASRHAGVHLASTHRHTVILADTSPDPAQIALDLMARIEATPQELVAVITPSMIVANEIMENVNRLRREFPEDSERVVGILAECGGIISTRDMDEAIRLINRYPPRELILLTEDPLSLLSRISGCGAIHLGPAPPPLAPCLTLDAPCLIPAGSSARYASPPSLADFGRTSTLIYRSRVQLGSYLDVLDHLYPGQLRFCRRAIESRQGQSGGWSPESGVRGAASGRDP